MKRFLFLALSVPLLSISIQAQTQNPSLLAANPQNAEQKKVSVCCLTSGELAALQAKAERGDVAAEKTMVEYYDKKIRDADFGSDIDDCVANYLKWLRKLAEGGDVEAQRSLGTNYDQGDTSSEECRRGTQVATEGG